MKIADKPSHKERFFRNTDQQKGVGGGGDRGNCGGEARLRGLCAEVSLSNNQVGFLSSSEFCTVKR